jgi:uncharacterized protein YbjT (DUF2867 family)
LSVLLVGLPADVAAATIERLISQDDEVRIVTPDRDTAESAKSLGAHVAMGDYDDPDLLERAAQNVRTLVFGETALKPDRGEALVNGGVRAGVGRWIYCSDSPQAPVVAELKSTGADVVVLTTGPKGLLRRGTEPQALARAIDAADDLADHPQLELNLKEGAAWTALKLEAP